MTLRVGCFWLAVVTGPRLLEFGYNFCHSKHLLTLVKCLAFLNRSFLYDTCSACPIGFDEY